MTAEKLNELSEIVREMSDIKFDIETWEDSIQCSQLILTTKNHGRENVSVHPELFPIIKRFALKQLNRRLNELQKKFDEL